jgi:hypothetical protein
LLDSRPLSSSRPHRRLMGGRQSTRVIGRLVYFEDDAGRVGRMSDLLATDSRTSTRDETRSRVLDPLDPATGAALTVDDLWHCYICAYADTLARSGFGAEPNSWCRAPATAPAEHRPCSWRAAPDQHFSAGG